MFDEFKTKNDEGFKKFDTQARTIYFVRLAMDARVFQRDDKEGEDVVITFCDNSRINNTEELWVDARVARFQADRAKKLRKGDEVQVEGKLRFKVGHDGRWRGKMYDATFHCFARLNDREDASHAEKEDLGLTF